MKDTYASELELRKELLERGVDPDEYDDDGNLPYGFDAVAGRWVVDDEHPAVSS